MTNQHITPEEYLGKSIDKILMTSELNLINQTEEKRTYLIHDASIFGATSRTKLITINPQDIVLEVAYGFDFKITQDLFEVMVAEYGEPSEMFKHGQSDKVIHNREISEGYIAVEERSISVDCNFNEDPIFLIWDFPHFTISITRPPNQDSSMITYQSK